MIDILGWGEWVIIGVLALILIGPKDLPRVLYKVGRWFQSFKEKAGAIRQEFEGLIRVEHLKVLEEEDDYPDSFPEISDVSPVTHRTPRPSSPASSQKTSKRRKKFT